ncbi:MAG TPA: NYN domain-containing protein [Anaerolineales bacterium]|nr:NYN domain-containing protein [Anaerolineales bacterium]
MTDTTNSSTNQIAIYIDFENILLSCREKFRDNDEDVEWPLVLGTAVNYGRVVIRRAYADWSSFSSYQRELLRLGVDLVHVTSKRGKNATDIRIVMDALEMLIGGDRTVTHVMLVSGDGDFTELVHRLRSYGKIVIGMGVSGKTAEYLINACDHFMFYDMLAGVAQPTKTSDAAENTISFDISEARRLMRQVLANKAGEWQTGGEVKSAICRLNPAFNERNYGYDTFKEFLAAQNDLVRIRTAQPGGHLEVQMLLETDQPAAHEAPHALLDRYLGILTRQKVRMTPTEHRPTIVLKLYDIFKSTPGITLTQLKENLHAYFDENAPHISWQYVHETVHELFHTYCFEFDKDDSKYTDDTKLWDRSITMAAGVNNGPQLLDKCDRGLLQKIGRSLGSFDKIDVEVAAHLLYGGVRGQRMLDHVRDLIGEINKKANLQPEG